MTDRDPPVRSRTAYLGIAGVVLFVLAALAAIIAPSVYATRLLLAWLWPEAPLWIARPILALGGALGVTIGYLVLGLIVRKR